MEPFHSGTVKWPVAACTGGYKPTWTKAHSAWSAD